MRNKSWTKKEEEFLLALSKEETDSGEKFPASIITVLFNDHFNRIVKGWNARSHGAIQTKLRELIKLEKTNPSNITVKFKAKKEEVKKKTPRGKNAHGDEPNSGRSWTPADDAYLVQNYTAHDDAQNKVAKHLGRSRKACYNRIRRLKNMNKIGMITMGSTLESSDDETEIEHMVIPEQRLPVTLLGYLVLWWRNRRKNKMIIKRRKLEEQLRRLS
jgi:hypothetical protein|tara:strand:- start:143 stop:790 length:648 start_codon:yes stop_codon:yes gene_type:complete